MKKLLAESSQRLTKCECSRGLRELAIARACTRICLVGKTRLIAGVDLAAVAAAAAAIAAAF